MHEAIFMLQYREKWQFWHYYIIAIECRIESGFFFHFRISLYTIVKGPDKDWNQSSLKLFTSRNSGFCYDAIRDQCTKTPTANWKSFLEEKIARLNTKNFFWIWGWKLKSGKLSYFINPRKQKLSTFIKTE